MSIYIKDVSWKPSVAIFNNRLIPQGKLVLASVTTQYGLLEQDVGNLNGNFEIEIYFKRSTTGTTTYIFSKHDSSYTTASKWSRGWNIKTDASGVLTLNGYGTNDGTLGTVTFGTANNTNWHTIILKRTNTTVSVNLDGGAFTTSTDANLNAGLDISNAFYSVTNIGRIWYNNAWGSYFNGEIEYIKIWKGGDRSSGTLRNYYLFNNASSDKRIYDSYSTQTGYDSHSTQVSLGTTVQTYGTPKVIWGNRCTSCLKLDGTDDYGTLPSNVGDYHGINFEVEIRMRIPLGYQNSSMILCSRLDTSYTANPGFPKGFYIVTRQGNISFSSWKNNVAVPVLDTDYSEIIVTPVVWSNTYHVIKFGRRAGTTCYLSVDGTEVTTTGAVFNAGLDNVLNEAIQLGRFWRNNAWGLYENVYIDYIKVTKGGVLTNTYNMSNTGTNQTLIDATSGETGASANGSIQAADWIECNGIPRTGLLAEWCFHNTGHYGNFGGRNYVCGDSASLPLYDSSGNGADLNFATTGSTMLIAIPGNDYGGITTLIPSQMTAFNYHSSSSSAVLHTHNDGILTALSGTNAHSISMWCYSDSSQSVGRLFQVTGGTTITIDFATSGGIGKVRWDRISDYSGAVRDAWVHLAFVYNGATAYLYLNGNLVSQNNTTASYTKNTQFNYGDTYNTKMKGVWGTCRIYNRALTQTEVRMLFNRRQHALNK